jgi:antirestriction protein ArdC
MSDRLTRRDAYEIITSRILSALEKGTVPWHQPWTSQPPANLITRKAYRGVNAFVLSCSPYASPWWATYRQIEDLGGHVRRGEHGTPVCFWKWIEKEQAEQHNQIDPPADRMPILRYYIVFNSEQCQGIAHHLPVGIPGPTEAIAAAEAIAAGMPHPPRIQCRGGEASYSPRLDLVTIPALANFENPEAYHSTLFHELAHSTGHPTRLNRPSVSEACPFGSTNYSKEELVAEMAAAFLCGHAGISNSTIDSSSAYIVNWLSRLSQDRKLLIHAAGAAQKAADCILGESFSEA